LEVIENFMEENTVFFEPRIALNWFEKEDYENPIHTTNKPAFDFYNRI
jgi:hypothetical protein